MSLGMPCAAADIAIDRAPLTGRTLPSRASSPTMAKLLELFRQELAGGDQEAQRNRQVEAAGVFTEVGRG